MIRLKISNFIKKHKDKIQDLIQKIIIVAMGIFIATIILSVLSNIDYSENVDKSNEQNVYKPTETIIKGDNVSKEQYEEDKTLVNTFLEYCNNGEVEKAYNLLSKECKQEVYTTLNIFQENYYKILFDKKRECNLQAWISTKDYIVYKVRYANNMLATGVYDESDVYQDYITLNRKNDTEKISIGNFVDSIECSIITETEQLKAEVIKKTLCMTYEEYEIKIKNKTNEVILLNNLKNPTNIAIVTQANVRYNAYTSKIFINDLIIYPESTKNITIRFKKNLSIDDMSKEIQISNIIKNYELYKENQDKYTDLTNITIELED